MKKTKKTNKTNAMRILERLSVPYNLYTYEVKDGKIDGKSVADKIQKKYENVYKTLITKGKSGQFFVFVVSVENEIDLKKAAATVGEKSVEMIASKTLFKTTGYIRGGCSPIGMKTKYKTVLDENALLIDTIVFSGGKIGIQLETTIENFEKATLCGIASITK